MNYERNAKKRFSQLLIVLTAFVLCFGLLISCGEKVEESQITIGFGTESKIELQYEYGPLTWKSSDETVATVDENGVVRGAAPGSAEVSAIQNEITVVRVMVNVEAVKAEIDLAFGAEKQIELPEASTLSWKSSDETVATVDENGVVHGAAPGSAEITTNKGESIVATVTINVEAVKMEIDLEYGAEKQIELPEADNLSWKSSDEIIATVNENGVVRGTAPGSAEITVNKGESIVATVTVTVHIVEPTAIFISQEKLEMKIEATETLTYLLMPDNASDYGITWKSSNPSIADVDENGVVTAISDGTATIICSSPNGQMATCTVTVQPKSAIEQLNAQEKRLFDFMVNNWLPSFYNAPAVRIRNLYYAGEAADGVIGFLLDIQGMNRLGGYVYKYYLILLYDGGGFGVEAPSPDLSKPVPANEIDYKKINAALEEYWGNQGVH